MPSRRLLSTDQMYAPDREVLTSVDVFNAGSTRLADFSEMRRHVTTVLSSRDEISPPEPPQGRGGRTQRVRVL